MSGLARRLSGVGVALACVAPPCEAGPRATDTGSREARSRPYPSCDEAPIPQTLRHVRELTASHRYEEAEALARRYLAHAESTYGVSSVRVAQTLEVLLAALRFSGRTGDLNERRALAERSLAIRVELLGPDDPCVAKPLTQLGNVLRDDGDLAGARIQIERALELRERVWGPRHRDVARSLENLAGLLEEIGDREEAGRLYDRALEVLEGLPDLQPLELPALLSRRGHLHAAAREYDAARRLIKRGLLIREQHLDPGDPAMARSQHDLALLLAETDELDRALSLSASAVAIHEGAFGTRDPHLVRILNDHAKLLSEARRTAEAVEAYERSLDILDDANGLAPLFLIGALDGLAKLLWASGDVEGAAKQSLRGARFAREQLQCAFRGLSEAEALHFRRARRSALDVALSILSQDGGTGQRKLVSRAWDEIILSRAMIMDEMAGRHRELENTRDPELASLADDLRRAQEHVARLKVAQLDTDARDGHPMLAAAQADRDRAERALAVRSLSFGERLRVSRAGLSEVARALPGNSSLVAYVRFTAARRSEPQQSVPVYVAFVLNSGSRAGRSVPLGEAATIDRIVQRWREEIAADPRGRSDAPEAAYRAAGERLRRAVWDPVSHLLDNPTLVLVVPDASLNLVNLSTLPDGDGRYLLETGPALHYLTAEQGLLKRSGRDHATSGLLSLGGADFDAEPRELRSRAPSVEGAGTASGAQAAPGAHRGPGPSCPPWPEVWFPPLKSTALEAEEVASLWEATSDRPGGGTTIRLIGREADEATLKRLASSYRVLHLATHGFLVRASCAKARPPDTAEDEAVLVSGLALAGANRREEARSIDGVEDGILTAEEIAALDLSGVEWAVLSGCDTGLGEILAGEGVLGLRRAFEVAGAGTLIMSLWAVEDEAARLWMKALYEARLEGLATAQAVRRAALDMVQSQRSTGRTTHPFFWGAFVAAGDWR